MAHDEKTAERVRAALSGKRGVVEKKLMGGLCFMVSGSMCCSVSGRGGRIQEQCSGRGRWLQWGGR